MSSEIHKYIETSIEKKQNLFQAEVIHFPNDKKINHSKNLEVNAIVIPIIIAVKIIMCGK